MSLTYRCLTCGEVLKSWAACDGEGRHGDTHPAGGASFELLGLYEPGEPASVGIPRPVGAR